MQKSKKGFTLLEILVVITLIIIVAGITLPRFAGVADEGRKAKAHAELKTFQTALESYLLNNTSTVPATFAIAAVALEAATPRLIGKTSTLYDPFLGNPILYQYVASPNRKYYVVWSRGPNRVSEVTGIDNVGNLAPSPPGDDIFVTNGQLT